MTALLLSLTALGASVWLMVEGAEKITEALQRLSVRFGIASFAAGYLLSGIDLDNLAVGVVAASESQPGISLGTVVGAATFLLTFAVGITALIRPLETHTPKRLLVLTLVCPLPMLAAGLDGVISRVDGAVLLALSVALLGFVLRTARTHPLLRAGHKSAKAARPRPSWWAAFLFVGGSVAIVVGAELFAWSVGGVLGWIGWSGTRFGMLIVAAAVSAEEIPRMAVPALRGDAGMSVGNILGTILFFVLFNLGVIALVAPLTVERSVLTFYWPGMYVSLLLVSALLWRGRISRRAGALLVAAYALWVLAAMNFT